MPRLLPLSETLWRPAGPNPLATRETSADGPASTVCTVSSFGPLARTRTQEQS
jgi:hypothetical protein